MSCRTLFISISDFKDRVDLNQTILQKYIIPNIALVQDRYVKKILCTDFYNELLEQVEESTLTTANETLMTYYIKPYMVYRSYARYTVGANIYSTNAGFRKFKEDNSDSASNSDMNGIVSQADSDAQYYENELTQFLEDNASDYPTWATECNCTKKSITNFKISKIGTGIKKNYPIESNDTLTRDYLNSINDYNIPE
jgi:hypothetical protein